MSDSALATSQPETSKDDGAIIADSPKVEVYKSFEDMPLHQDLLRGIHSCFVMPSAIQQRAIVPLIKGGDIIAQAQSGTGKTGAFCIGTLARIDWRDKTLQALVLSPTRELAIQNRDVLAKLGEYLSENNASFAQTFVGGTRVRDDIDRIQSGVMVAIGTPGRVLDLMKRGAFRTDTMKLLVLDEADNMLSAGFQAQINDIFRFMPKDIQVACFSATMPGELLSLADKFMRTPTRILLNPGKVTLEEIKQFYVAVEEDHKLETLMDLYESVSIAQSVIFANTKRTVDFLSEQLNKSNHAASAIHSETPNREEAMAAFRSGASRVLVTTDLLARVIDKHHVNIVVNFDLPANVSTYLDRIGRGGRYGRKGVAINFVSQRDALKLRDIEQHYGTVINELPMNFSQHLSE